MTRFQTHESVRAPVVASLFYPGDTKELKENLLHIIDEVNRFEENESSKERNDELHIKSLSVPHASFVYSGTTASLAFHLLHKNQNALRRIILLGPAHRVCLECISPPSHNAF